MPADRVHLRDDAGREVSLADCSDVGLRDGREALLEMIKVVWRGEVRSHSRTLVIISGVILLLCGALVVGGIFASGAYLLALALPISMAGSIVGLLRWRIRSEPFGPRNVADGLLRRGRCPACTHLLTGLPAREDDLVICPECGAAWHRSRMAAASDV